MNTQIDAKTMDAAFKQARVERALAFQSAAKIVMRGLRRTARAVAAIIT